MLYFITYPCPMPEAGLSVRSKVLCTYVQRWLGRTSRDAMDVRAGSAWPYVQRTFE